MLQRPSTFAITKSLLLLISYIPSLHSRPVGAPRGLELFKKDDGFPEEDPSSGAFWWKLGISLVLVLLGGVFAG
jgi:metal transporter CNNM